MDADQQNKTETVQDDLLVHDDNDTGREQQKMKVKEDENRVRGVGRVLIRNVPSVIPRQGGDFGYVLRLK